VARNARRWNEKPGIAAELQVCASNCCLPKWNWEPAHVFGVIVA
jgi:hypothetical protein